MPPRPRVYGHGSRKRRRNRQVNQELMNDIFQKLEEGCLLPKAIYAITCKLSKVHLQVLHRYLLENESALKYEITLSVKVCLAARLSKTLNPCPAKARMYIPVKFSSKGMELLQLHTLIKDRKALKLLGVPASDINNLVLSYQYV